MSHLYDAETLHLWQTADAVCFDVDSTVSIDEGIDELAAFCGAGEAVAAWTARSVGVFRAYQLCLLVWLAMLLKSHFLVFGGFEGT